MPNHADINLNSPIFNDQAVNSVMERVINRRSREFVISISEKVQTEQKTGKLYPRKSGNGFKTFHRASAKGQRPAVDRGVLLRNIKRKSLGPSRAEVTVIALNKGFDYAAFHQANGRETIRETDVAEEQVKMLEQANRQLRELI